MGKQRSKVLKTKAKKVFELFSDKFTTDFEKNKNLLREVGLINYSKVDRNIIAGYITALENKLNEAKKDE